MRKNRNKCRRISIFARIAIASTILTMMVAATIGINSTLRRRQETIEMAGMMTEEVALLSKVVLSAEDIDKAVEGDEDAQQLLCEQLNDVRENSGMEYVYLLMEKDGQWVYLADGSEDASDFGDAYEDDYELLEACINGENYVSDTFEQYEDMYLINTYCLIDEECKVLLGADLDATSYKERIDKAWRWVIGLMASTTAFAVSILTAVAWSVASKIRKVTDKIEEINSSDGDLTTKLDIKSGDEMELLADSFNSLLDYIRSIVNSVKINTVELRESAHKLNELVVTQNDATQNTASAMEEMSAATEEISASLQSITGNVNNATESAEKLDSKVYEKANHADTIMSNVSNKAEQVRVMADNIKDNVGAMTAEVHAKLEESKHVTEIRKLTEAILEIASQTNLLSLNARIEAAHAGDAGKGFAVVASEIQKLADNCASTAKDIQRIADRVINAVEELINTSNEFIEFTEQTTETQFNELLELSDSYYKDADEFKTALDEMVESTRSLQDDMNSINTAVRDVSLAVDENARGITEVAEATSGMSSDIQTITEIADKNKKASDEIGAEMNKFKS